MKKIAYACFIGENREILLTSIMINVTTRLASRLCSTAHTGPDNNPDLPDGGIAAPQRSWFASVKRRTQAIWQLRVFEAPEGFAGSGEAAALSGKPI